jgi:hypothetical protein
MGEVHVAACSRKFSKENKMGKNFSVSRRGNAIPEREMRFLPQYNVVSWLGYLLPSVRTVRSEMIRADSQL